MLNYANNFRGSLEVFPSWLQNTCKHMYREQGLSKLCKLSAENGFSDPRAEWKVFVISFIDVNVTTIEKKRREKCDKSKTITTDMLLMSLQDSFEHKAVTSLTFQFNR